MRFFRFLALCSSLFAGVFVRAQSTVPTVSQSIPGQSLSPGAAAKTIDVSSYFSVPGVTGQIVQFDTVFGKFNVELRADAAPKQVANFLGYVQRGDYRKTFIHRSATFDGAAISIIQGGGYTFNLASGTSGAAVVAKQAPVPLEYNLPNERGTLAAARTSDINSATSEWFFNVRDNTSILGPANNGGYTVFARVLGSGMSVVDVIAALPRVNAGTPFTELPVRDYAVGSNADILESNLAMVSAVTPASLFSTGSGAAVVTFTVQNSASDVVATAMNGSSLTLTPLKAGSATITVRATDTNGNTADNTFTVAVVTTPPSFTTQPVSQTIAIGDTVVFNSSATAAASYRWQKNGVDIPGATTGTLVIRNSATADSGNYQSIATNALGSVTSTAASLAVTAAAPSNVGRLVNLAIRSNAGVGDQTLIVGFSVGGAGTTGTEPLLVRGVGPSLTQFGLTNVLADPQITMYSGNTALASNNNWGGDSAIQARADAVGAFALPANSLDAALATSPAGGGYTVQVTGNGGGTGIALAEIYDATSPTSITTTTPRLTNLSARTQVGTGNDILIAGFVVRGSTSKTVLIRATGPALAGFGVTGALANPKLQLYADSTLMMQNDDWAGDSQIIAAASAVGAFPIANGGSKDAALLVTLKPGSYSAQVSGADGGTGVALVEVYELQ
jgi:cyclophilin family peptidyl-prolyl cis-trans isomerase